VNYFDILNRLQLQLTKPLAWMPSTSSSSCNCDSHLTMHFACICIHFSQLQLVTLSLLSCVPASHDLTQHKLQPTNTGQVK
jgi:hypothetical protein